ncbi:MAG TPA: hypothetical protein VHN36_04450 [Ilumatobacteraceae bacterium]|nr:hypothetical protein [Ilumatobacteraceae bacterium]
MKIGRTIAAAVLGFLFLLFVAADLVLFGVVPLNSVVVTILPAAGLVLGAVLGALAGNRRRPPEEFPQELPQEPMQSEPFAPPSPA